MISGIPLILGLGISMRDPYVGLSSPLLSPPGEQRITTRMRAWRARHARGARSGRCIHHRRLPDMWVYGHDGGGYKQVQEQRAHPALRVHLDSLALCGWGGDKGRTYQHEGEASTAILG